MEILIDLPALAQALDAARSVAPKVSSHTILEMGLWATEGDETLLIAATNLQTGVVIRVPCRVVQPGRAIVPFTLGRGMTEDPKGKKIPFTGAPLASMLKELGPGPATVKHLPGGDTHGHISIWRDPERVTTLICGADPDDYPALPSVPGEGKGVKTARMSLAYVLPALRTLAHYTLSPKDQSRPALRQIQVKRDGEGAVLSSSDGLRGGVHQVHGFEGADLWLGVWPDVSPLALVEAQDVELTMTATDAHLFLDCGRVLLIQTRGSDALMNITQFMPIERTTWLIVDRAAVLRALHVCEAIKEGKGVVAIYCCADGAVLRAADEDATIIVDLVRTSTDPQEKIPVRSVTGPEVCSVVRVDLLLAALTPIPTPEIAIGFGTGTDAIVCRPVGAGERTIRHIVMPYQSDVHAAAVREAPTLFARLPQIAAA